MIGDEERPATTAGPAIPANPLPTLIAERAVIVCAGPGGVGKTSIAAALALQAAHQGRHAVVVTIDPAKRLADALGLQGFPNEPHELIGPWPGSLHAVILDTKATFDELIGRHAGSASQTEAILDNRFYRNISHALSGTQEYMAAEKLYGLHAAGRFDLIVVDTPPTRQALDFLDAPGQLARFLDHRVYRLMTGQRKGVTRVVNRAAFAVLRTASRLVGTSVMNDAVAFFTAFEGMEAGFRQRSQDVRSLLTSEATTFLIVASPQSDTVAEADFFLRRIAGERLDVGAVLVNRVTPRFTTHASTDLQALAATYAGSAVAALLDNLADLTVTAEHEETTLQQLTTHAPGARLVRVPELPHDVHDLAGLDAFRAELFGS